MKVSKGRCPKALDDFADFSVLCQVGRFMFAFCYKFLMIFLCFGIFPFDRTSFSPSYYPEEEILCKSCKPFKSTYKSFASLHRVQILEFVHKNIAHNFYKMQKGHVIAFYKII